MKKKLKLFSFLTLIISLVAILVPVSLAKYRSTSNKELSFNVDRASFTIKFNSNGGTGSMSDMDIVYGDSQTLTSNTFSKSGYDFIGWNTSSDGSGTFYQNEQDISYITTEDDDEITLYAQWLNKNYLTDTTELSNYSCTGSSQTFTAPITGKYVLEAWGAQGGSVSANDSLPSIAGGKGGYSYGVVSLNAGDTVYITVGCAGESLENASVGTTVAGGYNGGGYAKSGSTYSMQGSGGGATHFAINNNLGELKNYSSNKSDILLVAGGGAGSYSNSDTYYYSYGGVGGGKISGNGVSFYDTQYRKNALDGIYYQGLIVPGATQSLQSGNDYYYGTFGKGADAEGTNSGTDAGAGGGWYGGNRFAISTGYEGMTGSGGSGYVNTSSLIEGKTIAGNVKVPTHNGSSYTVGNTGNGYARISRVNPHYTIKFDANGGTGTMDDMNFVYGTPQNLTANAFVKTNYEFTRWNTAANGTGTAYADEAEINNLTTVDQTEITLYAQWLAPSVYFQLPPDWYGTTVNIYFYNNSTKANSGWPGEAFTLVDNTRNIYGHMLTDYEMANYDRIIVTNGESIDGYDGALNGNTKQTVDIPLTSSEYNKVYVPELYSGSGTRVFFRKTGSEMVPHVYYWNDTDNVGWPGPTLTDAINDDSFQYIIPSGYNTMIFNNGYSGYGNQSGDFPIQSHQDLTYNLASGPFRIFYSGSWHNYQSWLSSEYNTWLSDDYVKFQAAKTELNY